MHCCKKIIKPKTVLSATENRILDNKEIAKLQRKKNTQGTIEITRYTACECRIDVQSIRQIAPLWTHILQCRLQSLLRPLWALESKSSTAALGTSGIIAIESPLSIPSTPWPIAAAVCDCLFVSIVSTAYPAVVLYFYMTFGYQPSADAPGSCRLP